jgi:hypothetical protein
MTDDLDDDWRDCYNDDLDDDWRDCYNRGYEQGKKDRNKKITKLIKEHECCFRYHFFEGKGYTCLDVILKELGDEK